MLTLKSWIDDFVVLPSAVKWFIYAVVLVLAIAVFVYTAAYHLSMRKVEKLEKANAELATQAADATSPDDTRVRKSGYNSSCVARRSRTSAAVHENSSEPRPSPVSGS